MFDKSCPYCSNEGKLYITTTDLNRRITDIKFKYYLCEFCSLLYLANIPENISNYYPDNYYYIPQSKDELILLSQHEKYKLDIVQQHKTSGKLIEIGPATGGFAYLAKEASYDVSVIEMSEKCCVFLKDTLGLNVVHSNNEVMSLRQQDNADVIALWHVIEHLFEPWSLIKAAAEKLNPGGVLILATPNPKSIQFNILKGEWVHLDAPRHIRLLSEEFIKNIAELSGLNLLSVTTKDEGSISWNRIGWENYLLNKFINTSINKISMKIGKYVSYVMHPFENLESKGCAYTVVLQKYDV